MSTLEKIVLYDSPEAAHEASGISGWVSRDGHYCGKGAAAENMARWRGCTHVKCEKCGAIHEKIRGCEACRNKRLSEEYRGAPTAAWDGSTPIVIQDSDHFFFDIDSLCEFCFDHECQPDELRLMHCLPNYARPLSSEHFCDDLPEDGEVPDELEDAINVFNAALKAYGKPLSWREGKTAVLKPTGITVEFEREDETP